MSDEKKYPAAVWINQLKTSVTPHTDPVLRLARQICLDGSFGVWAMGHEDDPGAIHFGTTEAWREAHPFAPHSMVHTQGFGSAEPFTRAVDGGAAMSLWLTPDALMKNVPASHARDLLRQRADALGARISDALKITPLEVRVFFPNEKLVEATAGTSHSVAAAVLFATTSQHQDKFINQVPAKLRELHEQAIRMKHQDAKMAKPELSNAAVEKMFAPHRHSGHIAYINDNRMAIDEVAKHVRGQPQIYSRGEDGRFVISYSDGKNTKKTKVKDTDIGLSSAHQHVLIIALDDALRVTPIPGKKSRGATHDDHANARQHDTETLRAFVEAIGTQCGGGRWDGKLIFDKAMEDFIAISIEGDEHPKVKLNKARLLITKRQHSYQPDDGEWCQYLDDRGVTHIPPGQDR